MIDTLEFPVYWDHLYRTGAAGWNLDSPNPVLEQLIDEEVIAPPAKLLAPGCGHGHDALYAARKSFTAYGVDFSNLAIAQAVRNAAEKQLRVEFLRMNIFDNRLDFSGPFDLIFEYTLFCALPQNRVPDMLARFAELLAPGGRLITVLFPIDGRPGGPPFAIDLDQFLLQAGEHFNLVARREDIHSVKPRKGKELLLIFEKKN